MEKLINYPNGDSYNGQVQDNKKEGIGAYMYKDGARYEGQFHDESIQESIQGSDLELSIINSLPMHQFKKNEAQERTINIDCAICLGEFEGGEWLKLLPNCNANRILARCHCGK